MKLKNYLFKLFILGVISLPYISHADTALTNHKPKHFNKIMVVIFENMSYAEIKDEPTFKKLIEYSGYTLDENGKLIKLMKKGPLVDSMGNGYAFFSRYYNNHNGGSRPTRPSQPNYIAMTSGSIQGVVDNESHDLNVDNLAAELIDANLSWKVYAEDLPDPNDSLFANTTIDLIMNNSSYVKPYIFNNKISEEEYDTLEHQYYLNYKKIIKKPFLKMTNGCFTEESYPSYDGYQRKHEPFISYMNIQTNYNYCKNILNSSHFLENLENIPTVSFYIPNQINDGHNGTLEQRVKRANAFLSKMMGTDPDTGESLKDSANAPFQKYMSQGGLLVITFDEPSVTGNPDRTIYTILAGQMINSGAYPNKANENSPVCYPEVNQQNKYPRDINGDYDPSQCNHYNLLKLIENNWNLRGLKFEHTSSGYKYALTLDNQIPTLWKNGL